MLYGSIALFLSAVLSTSCKKEQDQIIAPDGSEAGEEYSGGIGTTFDQSVNAFGHSLPNLSFEDNTRFVVGNSFFKDTWVIAPSSTIGRDGLGPIFNSNSCSGCHFKDGRGRPPLNDEFLSSMLIRLSIPGTNAHGGPLGDPNYGDQLSGSAIPGALSEGNVRINYLDVTGYYDDGTLYTLRKPEYEFINLNYGNLSASLLFSPRVAPQMPGLGLLEAVSESTILSFADETDVNKDGISGRPNYVWDEINNKTSIGRFGWKANQPGVRQQTAGAFVGDIGITSSLFTEQNLSQPQFDAYGALANGGDPEVTDDILNKVVYYSSTLSVPARKNWKDATVLRGKQLFNQLNCNGCHIPKMQTGTHPDIPELSNQTIRPYTDLLLHDMGPGLADGRPDFLATGNEWRTPPLWGISMVEVVNNHTFFLHDGRARNFTEAVLWHGGEAEKSKNAFKALSQTDRTALITFLESL